MRLTASIFTALLAFAPLPSLALPNAGALPGGTADGNVIDAAMNCGPHAHYVRGHRGNDRGWVKGHCVRDRRGH